MCLLLLLALAPFPVAEGEASYYRNQEFGGKPTASGELFDDTKLTCAMKEGAFNRYYLVVAETGAIIVRLNDRGPFVRGRVIDLSTAAMEAINGDGLVDVTIFSLPFQLDISGKICYNRWSIEE